MKGFCPFSQCSPLNVQGFHLTAWVDTQKRFRCVQAFFKLHGDPVHRATWDKDSVVVLFCLYQPCSRWISSLSSHIGSGRPLASYLKSMLHSMKYLSGSQAASSIDCASRAESTPSVRNCIRWHLEGSGRKVFGFVAIPLVSSSMF